MMTDVDAVVAIVFVWEVVIGVIGVSGFGLGALLMCPLW